MEKRKDNDGEIEKEEANNSSVLFSALRKDIADVLAFLERLKNEENQKALDVDQVEKLKAELAFICTYVQLSYSDLEQFEDVMTGKSKEVENLLRPILDDVDNNIWYKYNMHHALASLMDNIDDCVSSCHHSKSSATITEEQLEFLLLNIHHLSKYRAEQVFPLVIEYEILQNICGNVRDFHGLIVNGGVEHKIVQYVLPQFQLMAERVGLFLWNDQTAGDFRLFKLAHLFLKIIPIELEVMHICFTNLKDSTSAEVGRFIQKLLETSPDILREYPIHQQEHMINVVTPSTSGAQNIHVAIEFLLIILTDVPNDFIHHDKLFDLLARVGALTREIFRETRAFLFDRYRAYFQKISQSSTSFLCSQGIMGLFNREILVPKIGFPISNRCCCTTFGLMYNNTHHGNYQPRGIPSQSLMQEGSDGDEESVARSYSSVHSSADISPWHLPNSSKRNPVSALRASVLILAPVIASYA